MLSGVWFCGVMYISGLCGGLWFRLVSDSVICTVKYLESDLTASRTFLLNFTCGRGWSSEFCLWLTKFISFSPNSWINRMSLHIGATSHTARNSVNAINQLHPNHVVSTIGDISCPNTSPYLSNCDLHARVLRNVHSKQSTGEMKLRIR